MGFKANAFNIIGIGGSYTRGGAAQTIEIYAEIDTETGKVNFGISHSQKYIFEGFSYDFGPYHGSKSEERETKRDLSIQAGAQKTEDKIYKYIESGGIGPVTIEENEEGTTIKSDFDAEVEVNTGIVGVEVSMLVEYTKKNKIDKSSSRSISTEKKENDEKYTKNHY